jgi:acetoin:2,6-dichlorophenolindophenol oxidoreductase subunit beta
MRDITFRAALNEALREEMRRDERVFLIGEEIGLLGGAFGVTQGLLEEYGEQRVRDTPITEAAIVGSALGAAVTGMHPVAELLYIDFGMVAMDVLVNQVAKMRYMSGGKFSVPLVIRATVGAGTCSAAQHSQNLQTMFMQVPGILVAVPSTPHDAKGMLKHAIRCGDPVLFVEHQQLYELSGPVPEEEYFVPFGVAEVRRRGRDVTIVATLNMVDKALEAAQTLAEEGIEAEVIDPRTLVPLDKKTILASVRRTGRLVTVSEAPRTCSEGAEIAAIVCEEAFASLVAPVKRVAALDVPIPFNERLERSVLPQVADIVQAARSIV